MNLADDGYGNLVSIKNPFGATTNVYARVGGTLATFHVGTADHREAITEVRRELRLYGRAAVLAVINGGSQ